MTEPNRKKLLWSVADRHTAILIKNGVGAVVTEFIVVGPKSREKILANARLIVKAVNSHEELTDAVGAAYALLMPIAQHSENRLVLDVVKQLRAALDTEGKQ